MTEEGIFFVVYWNNSGYDLAYPPTTADERTAKRRAAGVFTTLLERNVRAKVMIEGIVYPRGSEGYKRYYKLALEKRDEYDAKKASQKVRPF